MKYYEVNFHIQLNDRTDSASECSTDKEMFIRDVRALIAAYAGETGFETFEDTSDGLKGYVQTSIFDAEALAQAMEEIPFEDVTITYDVTEAEDKDWNEQWENDGFEPITVKDICVIHDGRHIPDGNNYAISVEIDAKLAFGTGTHETTRMMVEALLETELAGKNVLDCGCGTGILGIVALKRGASIATGYDIDEWSVDNTRHNTVINMVDDRYEWLLGDASVLDSIEKQYDIVMANINRNILLSDMPRFRKMMYTGASLMLSGFYTEDMDMLKEKAENLGLQLERHKIDNNWACMIFRMI